MKQREWSKAELEEVAIGEIEIGERRREKLGPIASLADSIERNGLLHPLVVTEENVLVAGRRRLAAMEKLGWKKVPVRRFEKMSPDELRALELEENTQRLDLSDYESSKQRLREIEAAEAEPDPISAQSAQKCHPQGRKPGGDSAASRKLGVSRDEVARTRKHVETADAYPVFKGDQWSRGKVLEAKRIIEKIPEKHIPMAIEMISEPHMPPEVAVEMLDTFATKPASELATIEKLYRSEDEDERSIAVTRAAKRPPPPNRLPWTREARRETA